MTELFNEIQNTENYNDKNELLMIVLLACNSGKFKVKKQRFVYDFCINEIKKVTLKLDDSKGFNYNDNLLTYGEKLFNILILTELGDEDNLPLLQNFTNVIKKFLGPIDTIFELCEKETNSLTDATRLINELKNVKDVELFNKTLFHLLESQSQNSSHFSDDAKDALASFINLSINNLAKKYDTLNENEKHTLLALVDLSYYYFNKDTESILPQLAELNDDLCFSVIRQLLQTKKHIDINLVSKLAQNLEYASTLYSMLNHFGQEKLFPQEYTNNLYLSKSALVRWLLYPTELGKAPDKIEYITTEKIRKSEYYIYKFMSDSNTLANENKNVWLVGWANADGNTFSDFEPLSTFETENPKKTMKQIIKSIKRRKRTLK